MYVDQSWGNLHTKLVFVARKFPINSLFQTRSLCWSMLRESGSVNLSDFHIKVWSIVHTSALYPAPLPVYHPCLFLAKRCQYQTCIHMPSMTGDQSPNVCFFNILFIANKGHQDCFPGHCRGRHDWPFLSFFCLKAQTIRMFGHVCFSWCPRPPFLQSLVLVRLMKQQRTTQRALGGVGLLPWYCTMSPCYMVTVVVGCLQLSPGNEKENRWKDFAESLNINV